MNMNKINEQVKELRYKADIFEKSGCAVDGIVKAFREAADTIETLSAKQAAMNIEWSEISKYDEMRKELKHSIIDLDAEHYKLSEFMRVIDDTFVKYRNEIVKAKKENIEI